MRFKRLRTRRKGNRRQTGRKLLDALFSTPAQEPDTETLVVFIKVRDYCVIFYGEILLYLILLYIKIEMVPPSLIKVVGPNTNVYKLMYKNKLLFMFIYTKKNLRDAHNA